MPWTLLASVPLSAAAGEFVGNEVKEALKDEHWLVQNIVSGLAEAATTGIVGAAINLVAGDVPSATTVTPAQAAVQGIMRAATGESCGSQIAKLVFSPDSSPTLSGPDSAPALTGPSGPITRHPTAFLAFENR